MKRIDRIFGALGDTNNNSKETKATKRIKKTHVIDIACNEKHEHDDGISNAVKSLTSPLPLTLACNKEHDENVYNTDTGLTGPTQNTTACYERQDDTSCITDTGFTGPPQKTTASYARQDDNSCNNVDSPIAPLFSPLTPLVAKKKTDHAECIESPIAPLFSPLTPLVAKKKTDHVECNYESSIESPIAPLFSPLTPLVAKKKTDHAECNYESSIESPIAPLFSPVTQLVAKKKTDHVECNYESSTEENLSPSPVPPMTPNTLELLNTLGGALGGDDENVTETEMAGIREIDFDELQFQKNNPIGNNQDHLSGFSSDTDSDYVPESDGKFTDSARRSIISSDDDISDDDITECHVRHNVDVPENEISVGRPKKGRKRKHKEHTLVQAKERKYSNLPYHGKNKFVAAKVFQDFNCTCINTCHLKVSREKREEEFKKYVTLGSYEAQLLYILNSVTETPKVRSYTMVKGNKTGINKPKAFTRTYKINDIIVCRDMFIKTFQITPKKVDMALKKKRNNRSLRDQRGQFRGGWNKKTEEDVEFIKNVINSLPKYNSHYRREQNGDCQFLKPGMTIQKIYDLYVEKFKDTYGESKTPLSISLLKRTFLTNFNLRCKSLKKDTCSRCDTFSNKIKNCTVLEEKLTLKEKKEEHLKKAENLRNCMNEDLKRAKIDESFECLTFDLEKTLPLPRIPTSIVFYKRQLWLYNCGIHAGSSDSGHCYLWVEGEAGRGAQEVASCLINFIKNKLDSKVKDLSLWSDCCGGQNRNIKIILMLKAILNSHQTLESITFNYLESGHTFLPNDTDFKIETQLKFHERIYTPEEYINVIKSCKKKNPLMVYRMEKKDFLSCNKLEKKIVNRKIFNDKSKTNWLLTKHILIKKSNVYGIFMKSDLNEEFKELDIEKKVKGKTNEISEDDFAMLWPDGKEIPQAKLDDLKSMFDLIPKDCLQFYKSLRGNINLEDDIEMFNGPLDFSIDYEGED